MRSAYGVKLTSDRAGFTATVRPIGLLPRECDANQPVGPAVYRLYAAPDGGQLLYVGVSRTYVSYRITKHLREPWGGQVQGFSITYYRDEAAEREAIRSERPLFNIRSAVSA